MSVLIELRLVSNGSEPEPMKPVMMFDTVPTPRLSMRIAKNRTQKPALFVVTATAVASAARDLDPFLAAESAFVGEMLLVRPSYWLATPLGRHTHAS